MPKAKMRSKDEVLVDANNFTHSELGRGLILIHESVNDYEMGGWVKFILAGEDFGADLKNFCKSPDKKGELIMVLEQIIRIVRDSY